MAESKPDIQTARLSAAEIAENFGDLHPPLARAEALIEADRCYFCYDAPCTTACPTGIDIPVFIQKIRSDNVLGSAKTILSENIMGGMCARVCPTEVLCEEACVRNTHEDKPVEIGLLQRYATDPVFSAGTQLFERAESTGKAVAVVGGGPAGLSCAHRLSMLGHDVVVFNRDSKLGGLNEYGIAAYKTINDFAQTEVDWILSIGGIEVRNGQALGRDIELPDLLETYDAVFLGIGLGSVNELGLDKESMGGVLNAIDYIADLRQAEDKSTLPVVVYRRGPEQMGASGFEQDLALTNGVVIHHWAQPMALRGDDFVTGISFADTEIDDNGKLTATGESFELEADVVFKAIGQRLDGVPSNLDTERGKITVDDEQRTSLSGVWAGGDCVVGGDDLTVSAVQHGKLAAISIDDYLRNGGGS